MTGGESLLQTLVACGVDVCFANPGTTELHLTQAVDRVPGMRAVLALFEGVCTGAADGYGRMKGHPAMTLLHLGPGLGNGLANLHNARRARTPVINVVGNHPSYHIDYDPPLTSDIERLAQVVSCWVKSDSSSASLAQDGAAAVAATLSPTPAYQGQIATLIVPWDAAWGHAIATAEPPKIAPRPAVSSQRVEQTVKQLDDRSVLLLDASGASQRGLKAGAQIAGVAGCQLMIGTFAARVDGGPGSPQFQRLPYFPEQVQVALAGARRIVLAGAEAPVAFFGYPSCPSSLVPAGCQVHVLARADEDVEGALEATADAMHATGNVGRRNPMSRPQLPAGTLTARTAAAVIANQIPDHCIVAVDTSGGKLAHDMLQTSAPHTWLPVTGGSIGQGGPVAVGAAIAAPGRRVLALLGDGAAMYTNQAFWTQAREGLDVTTVIYSNRKYWILQYEHERLDLPTMSNRPNLLDLDNPTIGWVELAASMGIPGTAVDSCETFAKALARSFAQAGPYLIEAIIPSDGPQTN